VEILRKETVFRSILCEEEEKDIREGVAAQAFEITRRCSYDTIFLRLQNNEFNPPQPLGSMFSSTCRILGIFLLSSFATSFRFREAALASFVANFSCSTFEIASLLFFPYSLHNVL